MKNIAIITPTAQEFRVYKNGQLAIKEHHNFIHVTNSECLNGIKFNDHISLSNRFKMPNHDAIVKEVINNINRTV
jgi:hypothetical protein